MRTWRSKLDEHPISPVYVLFVRPLNETEAVVSRRSLGLTIWALSAMVTVAWLVEAFTEGRGFMSTYLAPFAIAGNLVSMPLMRKRAPGSSSSSSPGAGS